MKQSFSMAALVVVLITMLSLRCHGFPGEKQVFDPDGDTLPDVYPTHSEDIIAKPIFINEPTDTYAMKGEPAELQCKVAHADKVYFVCNGNEIMQSSSEKNLVDEQTGLKVLEVQLTIRRSQVMDVIGKFSCKCVATSKLGQVRSAEAVVKHGYLRREFETPPYSQRIELGHQAILRCHPPKGDPQASVTHWLKNDRIINPEVDTNFIQNADGHLLILQARLEDTANYSCVAANAAQQRTSQPALLTIYVPGQWSEWGEWSECNKKCGRGVRKRVRVCNNPAPINDGPSCVGEAVSKENCHNLCPPVDGEWSEWNSWSSCSADCRQYRQRTCDNPAPKNGGRYCRQNDQDSRKCNGGLCKPGLNSIVLYGTESSPPQTSSQLSLSDITLIIGLIVAFVIFTVVVCILIRLLRRKPDFTRSPSGSSVGVMDAFPRELALSPTTTTTTSTDAGSSVPRKFCSTPESGNGGNFYDFGHSDRNSNCSSRKGTLLNHYPHHQLPLPTDIRRLSEHYYEQPMVVFNSKHGHGGDALERTPFINNFSKGQSSPGSSSSSSTSSRPEHANTIPESLNVTACNWATVSEEGGRICVSRYSVSLTIPKGALEIPQEMYIAVIGEEMYKPHLDKSQTPVTPFIVQCGPANMTQLLQKPIVLSVPHIVGGKKKLRVLFCEDLSHPDAEWEMINEDDRDGCMQIDSTMVHLVTERLGAYIVIASVTDINQIGGTGSTSVGVTSSKLKDAPSGYSSGIGSQQQSPDHRPSLMAAGTKDALARILDVPSCEGKDWQHLAKRLGLDHYHAYFAAQPSPSLALINLWETQVAESQATVQNQNPLLILASMLKEIRREDANVILERDLKGVVSYY